MEIDRPSPGALNKCPVVERKNRHCYAGIFVITAILLTNFAWTKYNLNHFVAVTVIPGTAVFAAFLIWRACLCVEELFHVDKVCRGSYFTVLKRTWSFNNASSYVNSILIIVFASSVNVTSLETLQLFGPFPLYLSTCAFVLLYFITCGEECPTWEAHTMRQFNGLDYGSGLAHSFFHGYLKLILPAKGIRDRIDDYIEKEKLNDCDFPVKKLIVLIPSSGYSYPTFCDAPSQTASERDIEPMQALQDHLRNRAGTKERVYRGAAYRIRVRSGNKVAFLYALAEGATPVLTFKEACSSASPEAEHLRQHKVDIVSNFYLTLKQLLDEDPDVGHLVELIYYNDEDISNSADVVSLLQEFLLKKRKELPGFD